MACNPTYKGKRYNSLDEIKPDLSFPELSKLYHTSKASGERPEFVKSIEELFNKTKENEKGKSSEGENAEGKVSQTEGQGLSEDQKTQVLAKAKGIIENTEFDGIHEEMKKEPERFLKYISDQASGSDEARTELESGKGITKSLIDLATELYPTEKKGAIVSRHGETDANVNKTKQGPDEPLNEKGKSQASDLGKEYAEKGIKKIIASPFTRTQETASIAASESGATVETNDLLKEYDPDTESLEEFAHRVEQVRELRDKSGSDTAIVTSGKVMGMLEALDNNNGDIAAAIKEFPQTKIYGNTETYIPSSKTKNNGKANEGRLQEGVPEKAVPEEGKGKGERQVVQKQEKVIQKNAEGKEGAPGMTAPSLNAGDKINLGGKIWNVEEVSDAGVKISDPVTNTITTIPKEEALKNIKQPTQENNNLEEAKIMRDSAARLRESGDEEGATQLEERAQEIEEFEKNPPNITSIANRVVNKERIARGFDPIQKAVRRAWKTEVLTDANDQINSGKVDPQILARELNKNPRALSDTEDAILTLGRMQLWNAHKNSMAAVEEAQKSGDKGAETVARMGLTYIEDAMYENDLASKKSGTANARGLAARRMMIASDYSLANQKQRMRVANLGKLIPKEVTEKLEKYSRELDEANRKLEEYENKRQNAEAEKELTKIKETVKKSPRPAKKVHEDFVKERKEIVSDIREKLKKARGETTATIVPYAKELFTISPDVAKLVRSLVEEGVSKLEDVVKNVYDVLKDEIKGITEKDVNDIIAGEYNEKKKPISDLASKLKDLRDEANLINKYEQLRKSPEPKEGKQKVERNKAITDLRGKIIDLKSETQAAGKFYGESDVANRRIEKMEDELQRLTERREKEPVETTKRELSDREKDLREKIDVERKAFNKEKREANKFYGESDTGNRKIEKMEDELQRLKDRREKEPKEAVKREISAREQKLKDDIASERKAFQKEEKEASKFYGEEFSAESKRLYNYKRMLLQKIRDTEKNIKEKNFEPNKRVPIVLDKEGQQLQADVENVKRKFDAERIKLEKANRSKYEKTLDFFTKWYRLDLLSGVTVLGKLTSAAQLRMIMTPLEEGIGGVLSHVPGISSIAKQSPREGGFSIAAEVKALSQYVDKATYKDMWDMVRQGKNPMELIYGKKYDLPAEAIGFFGQLHSALKVLPKRGEFYRSFEKRAAWGKKNGMDVSDPMIQMQIASAAYNDAARAIFMQDNLVSNAYKLGLNYLENKGDGGRAAAFVLRTLMPIIKVPTNIVGEALSYAGGGLKAGVMARKQIAGGMKMMLGLKKGIDKLTPDQADTVMRNLKKQTLGAAFLALGYFGSANVGGYYTGKRDEDEVEEGGLRMFGVDIPKWMVHNPALEMLQLGATIRKVQDKYEEAGKANGVEAGLLSGFSGLINQVPFIDNPKRITEALRSPSQADKYTDEFIKSITIPQLIQEAAKLNDEDEKKNVIKRYPTNLLEYEESGIPGARKNVPDEK